MSFPKFIVAECVRTEPYEGRVDLLTATFRKAAVTIDSNDPETQKIFDKPLYVGKIDEFLKLARPNGDLKMIAIPTHEAIAYQLEPGKIFIINEFAQSSKPSTADESDEPMQSLLPRKLKTGLSETHYGP